MSLLESRRVLSIQSHVVSGYVGNKAATFPLQILGWDVDAVNTVQYSNHAGYGRFGGPKTDESQLRAIFRSLEENGLMCPSRLLTGYIPGSAALQFIIEIVRNLRTTRPDLVYLLDPVMGDEGRLYVDSDVVPLYKQLLPKATIITPNWFEVELLTDIKLNSLSDVRAALTVLHRQYRVSNVVISSLNLDEAYVPAYLRPTYEDYNPFLSESSLLCLASSSLDPEPERDSTAVSRVHTISVPRIKGYFSGVGDLFSALVLAHFSEAESAVSSGQSAIAVAAARAVNTTHAILLDTQTHYAQLPPEARPDTDTELDKSDPLRRPRRMRARELRLVQNQDIIRSGGGTGLGDMLEWKEFWKTD